MKGGSLGIRSSASYDSLDKHHLLQNGDVGSEGDNCYKKIIEKKLKLTVTVEMTEEDAAQMTEYEQRQSMNRRRKFSSWRWRKRKFLVTARMIGRRQYSIERSLSLLALSNILKYNCE
ncbi:hypothetical protein ACFE04_010700 [Oxalis oulophora]